jgi:outer membrane protein assembly factor BamE (lipoprotein component of BamABCDE complex)
MVMRIWVGIAALLLHAAIAHGQQQRLTPEIVDRVREGVGRLTEDDVLKLVPGPVTIEMGGQDDDFDYILTWDDARLIRVEFRDGKVVSAKAAFSNLVASKTLTLPNFKKITKGMARPEVEKILGGPGFTGSFSERSTLDSTGKEVGVCDWMQGRRIFARIKGGRVTGAGSFSDPK